MADQSFDVVIVGGGCKGLSTGMYLAKYGGMKVGIFEETYELGGGLAGEQVAPGYQCNTHSTAQMTWYYDTIIKDDFPEIFEEDFSHCSNVACNVAVFDDDTAVAAYGWDQDPDGSKSAKEIARFSEKDAETYLRLREVYLNYLHEPLQEHAFTVNPPVGEPTVLEKAFERPEVIKAGLTPELSDMTGLEAAQAVFESPELIGMFVRTSISMGNHYDDVGNGKGLLLSLFIGNNHAAITGGTHTLTHALHRVLYRLGAKCYTHSPVEKAIIENGVAKGIVLKDGTQIEAKKAVISTLSPHQLCHDLIGPDYIQPEMMRKIDALETHRISEIYIGYAFKEKPVFKCRKFNPEIYTPELQQGINTFSVGSKSIDVLLKECEDRQNNRIPSNPLMFIVTDPDIAKLYRDPNACIWHINIIVPPATAFSRDFWIKKSKEVIDWEINELQKYCDNLSWDTVVGAAPLSCQHVADHFKNMGPTGNWNIIDTIPSQEGSKRPIPELAQHRTPVKNLYATGSAFGPWGMSSFCASYTCYKIMSEDMGLRQPWKEKNRAY